MQAWRCGAANLHLARRRNGAQAGARLVLARPESELFFGPDEGLAHRRAASRADRPERALRGRPQRAPLPPP